jgi:hypothetical protein
MAGFLEYLGVSRKGLDNLDPYTAELTLNQVWSSLPQISIHSMGHNMYHGLFILCKHAIRLSLAGLSHNLLRTYYKRITTRNMDYVFSCLLTASTPTSEHVCG